ncbi:CBS domain-containing protein [Streptomyces sp. TRM S81-3]|uniref:CBS domain-containing protein n=1 Tax=Streptomyces griseicoloratus TaxID=2752516 RepID=A0A926QSV8_9ACTN|nr:CBS domain-containing protein [Streptomyces griseicoloratus]MBD0422723.1 CBS domain-containing protein [Streptomyces griseicoloratus]
MMHNKVWSVMTGDVVRAEYDTPFKEVARLLADHHISGLPVVDDEEHVIGIVSETDLMMHQAGTSAPDEPDRRFHFTALTPAARRQAAARTAGQLMSQPPVTAHADDTIVEAARTMAQCRVERLPVLDEEDRLVGMVTRSDLLRVFLRTDAEIRQEVTREVLERALRLEPRSIDVSVTDGVVTLRGQMERKSDSEIAVSMALQLDGVVDVVDRLTYRLDDTMLQPDERPLQGPADDWRRGR